MPIATCCKYAKISERTAYRLLQLAREEKKAKEAALAMIDGEAPPPHQEFQEFGRRELTPSQRAFLRQDIVASQSETVDIPAFTPEPFEPRRHGTSSDPDYNRIDVSEEVLPGPIPYSKLRPEAQRALDDFVYFRRRYFGRASVPWQLDLAEQLKNLYDNDAREYLVVNVPPGSGKTTLIADFCAWLICRDRRIRILMGSHTASMAESMLMRVRRSLERLTPIKAKIDDLEKGLAFDAESALALDFGRFRPSNRELWTRSSFIVEQHDGAGAVEEKEATMTSYGRDSGFLGGRFDLSVWDDLARATRASSTKKEEDEEWYVNEAETRIDPGGLHVLVGQRLAADDLSRFCLDMTVQEDDDEDDENNDDKFVEANTEPADPNNRAGMKYKHLKYKAHYEDLCTGKHSRKQQPYPNGCLLDPSRHRWRDLSAIANNNPRNFTIVYQQEDMDPSTAMVKREYVWGDASHVGCWDKDRGLWEIPPGMTSADTIVIATADPSPTMYWSVQVWLFHENSQQRVLLDHQRAKMMAPEFLDYNPLGGGYSGLMEEWQTKSEAIGFPITHWIVERNAAQRFMLQYSTVTQWQIKRGVQIIGHDTTTANKSHEELGVSTLGPLYRLGRVRLPGKGDAARLASMKLVDEIVKYPYDTRTDDCVMAQWFLEWNLPNISLPDASGNGGQAFRPSWIKNVSF